MQTTKTTLSQSIKKIGDYPELQVGIECDANDECTIFMNMAPVGDLYIPGLKKSERKGFTHEYEKKFPITDFYLRLRDNEFNILKTTRFFGFTVRSFLFENEQVYVGRGKKDVPNIPSVLFFVELLDGKFKSKTFRAAMTGPNSHSAYECYAQVLNPDGKKSSKFKVDNASAVAIKEKEESKIVTVYSGGIDENTIINIVIGLEKAGSRSSLQLIGKDTLKIELPGVPLGN